VSEASVHSCLAPSLWACDEAAHPGKEHRVEPSLLPHGGQENRKTEERVGSSDPFKGTPPTTLFPPTF
jgi:hypothetical protein